MVSATESCSQPLSARTAQHHAGLQWSGPRSQIFQAEDDDAFEIREPLRSIRCQTNIAAKLPIVFSPDSHRRDVYSNPIVINQSVAWSHSEVVF